MHKRALYLLLFLFTFLTAEGQSWRTTRWEASGGLILANYFGDIGGSAAENTWFGIRDLDLTRSRPGMSGGLRYFTHYHIAFKGNLAIGWLSGSDKGGKNENREYIFNSPILEPSIRIEFFPFRDWPMGRGFDRHGRVRNYATLSAYIFGGTGCVFYYVFPNEKLSLRQERDDLRYGPVAIVLPAGIGFKIGINNNTDLGLEIGGRYAFSDFLDGFTSKTSTANDIYYLTSVQLIYRMPEFNLWFND